MMSDNYGNMRSDTKGEVGVPPANHLVWAILATVLCFWPLGIPSIVYAAKVNSRWAAGDVAGSQAASEKAKWFAISAVIAVPIVIILMIGVYSIINKISPGGTS